MATDSDQHCAGMIQADALYRLDEFKRRLGLGVHAMREARRAGLRVVRIGKRGYVLGKDALEFAEHQAEVGP